MDEVIDRYIMEHIVKCSEAEATRVLETGWKLSRAKLDAFIGLLYASGAYESKNLKIAHLGGHLTSLGTNSPK